MNEKLKKTAADNAEKLHRVKCSLPRSRSCSIGRSKEPHDTSTCSSRTGAARPLKRSRLRLVGSGAASRSRLSCRKGPSRGAHGRSGTMWYRSAETRTGSVNSPSRSLRTATWAERKAVQTAMQTRRAGSSRCTPSSNYVQGASGAG